MWIEGIIEGFEYDFKHTRDVLDIFHLSDDSFGSSIPQGFPPSYQCNL